MWVVIAFFAICFVIAFVKTFWPFLLAIAIIALIIFTFLWIYDSNKKKIRREEIESNEKFKQKVAETKKMVDLLLGTEDWYSTHYCISKEKNHPYSYEKESDYDYNDWCLYLHITMREVSNYTLKTISVFPKKREEIEEFFVKHMFNKSYDEAKEIIDIYDWIVAVNEGGTNPDSTYDESTIFFTLRIPCIFTDFDNNYEIVNKLTLRGNERNIFLDELKELGCNVKY